MPSRILGTMTAHPQPGSVAVLEPERGREPGLVDRLTVLVNDVYAIAEHGLWRDGTPRTTASEVAALIEAREIVVATDDGDVAGLMRLHDVRDDTSEFGMLVADPDRRGTGIGRRLLDFAERDGRDRRLRAIQLELLVPRAWSHPSKEFLKAWYGRRGYRLARIGRIEDAYPHLAPMLATGCDLEIHAKPLDSERLSTP
jgi:GNAT superfamily N-acetyltransferase